MEAILSADSGSAPASGAGVGGRGRRLTSRTGERGGSTWGKPKTQRPWILSSAPNRCPSLSLGPWGGVGTAREAPPTHPASFAFPPGFTSPKHPHHLSLARPPLPSPSWRPPECDPKQGRAPPSAKFVHFCVSLLCKLREMGGVGDPQPPRTPRRDVPGVRSHLQRPSGREKVPGNKSFDTPPPPVRGAAG